MLASGDMNRAAHDTASGRARQRGLSSYVVGRDLDFAWVVDFGRGPAYITPSSEKEFRMRRLFFLLVVLTASAFAQYTNLSEITEYGGPQEFAARRAELAKKIGGKGTVLLFARVTLPESSHYREDNDFFYYTGLREPGAAMLMDAASGKTVIFQPAHS